MSTKSTSDNEYIIPRRKLLKFFERLITPLLILACVVLVATVPLSFPATFPLVVVWIICALIYVLIRYGYRYHFRLFTRETVVWRAIIGTAGIWVMQLVVRYTAGSEYHGVDPNGLWILYIIPLLTVSRFGTTTQWWRLLAGMSGALLGLQFFSVISNFNTPAYKVGEWVLYIATNSQTQTTVIQIGILALIGGALHTLVRQGHMYEGLVHEGRRIIGHLASQPTFESAYKEAALVIQKVFAPNVYVFILLWDEGVRRLKLVGAAGKPRDVWENIELEFGQGISGLVMSSKEWKNIPNVRDPKWNGIYYCAPGFEDVSSELAVPIIYQGKAIGVLDLESPHDHEFDDRDRSALEGFAESLAVSFGHFLSIDEKTAGAYRLAIDTIEASGEHTRVDDWFAQVAESACAHLGALGLAFLRLAPGTGYPLIPPIVWPANLRGPMPRLPSHIPSGSIVWHILEDWQLRYWTAEDHWKEWNTQADRWLLDQFRSTGIATLVFVPVGSVDKPLAALFVAYPIRQTVGDVQRLALWNFAASLEKSYLSIAPLPLEIRRSGTAIHEVLSPCTEKLLTQIYQVRTLVGQSPDGLAKLDELEQSVRELNERVKRAIVNDRYDLSIMELEKALKETASDFEDLRPGQIRIKFENIGLAEDEPLYTRRILYQVIVEAISNAVEHGHCNLVEVYLSRKSDAIMVEITDDGAGLPPNLKRHSPYGIFDFKRKLRREMRARLYLRPIEPHGTRVVLELPLPSRKAGKCQ